MSSIKLICAGCRDFCDYDLLVERLDRFRILREDDEIEIVSGTCKGADKMGEWYAKEHGLSCKRFPAEWKRFGKSAGPIRNRKMAEYATNLIAFWDGNKSHSGTWNMIVTAQKLGLSVEVVQSAQSAQSQLF